VERELLAGRFMPLRRLGSGGMAEVLLARDTALGEDVALKIIHPHLARDPSLLQRFRTEIQVSRAVRHPGIIAVECLEALSAELLEG
jgi:eukaryotic-like serine/threonine-protein kinase